MINFYGKSLPLLRKCMRISTIIIGIQMCCTTLLLAHTTRAQDINLNLKKVNIKQVFNEIEQQCTVTFVYDDKVVNNLSSITLRVYKLPLAEVLKQLQDKTQLQFKVVGTLIGVAQDLTSMPDLTALSTTDNNIANTISGTVKDAQGYPLPGVTVQVKGTTKATSTGVDGSFSINADKDAILVFSFIGFEVKQVAVGDEQKITVTLIESPKVLNEVVVVGYGTTNRKALASSVSTVKSEDLNKGAITDVGQLLQGKVAGLNITASGDPNKPAAVVLRGASTINSSQGPFYVVDGVPGVDIAAIAPDDIASIDVLKDAAATAIYGNRAANGVIMVTTKRGKKGQMQISYNGYVGVEKVANQLQMMNAQELKDFLSKNGQALSPADDKGANTDWQKSIEKSSAISYNHNLSFSGGTEHGNYYASLNYVNKDGILLNSNLQRVIARLAIEQYVLDDKVKFGLSVTNSNSNADDIPYRNVVLLESALYLPASPIKNPDGSYFENLGSQNYYNPAAMINNSQLNTKYNNLVSSFTTQVKLPFGLKYDLNLSYLNSTSLQGEYLNSYFTTNYNGMYDSPDPNLGFHSPQSFGKNGQATRSSIQNTNKVLETYLTWDKKIGLHSINAVVGYSWQDNIIGDGFQATTSNFPVDNVGYNNFALSNPYAVSGFQVNFGPDGVYQQTRLISDFARLNYNYKEKYLLQASVRRDGSSVFGADHQWGYFPSVGAAWRISEENFMKEQTIISDLKLRASYGVTGNSSGFNAYSSQFISGSQGSYYYNGGYVGAFGPTQAANPNLQWEKTATTNVGLDFGILNGKLSGSLDLYDKKTTGMIYSYNVNPILVPAGVIVANGGGMSNKGIELVLSATPVKNNNFSWATSLNLAHNENVITSLSNPLFSGGDSVLLANPEGLGQSSHSLEILKAGKPLGQFFSLQYAGKNASGVSQYIDANGNLTTSPSIGTDYHYLGNAQPTLLLGWSNNFHYKNLDLNVFFRGVFGNKIFNATRADLFRPNTAQYTNILKDAASESTADFNSYLYSSRFIESGSYLRLDNATLAYNFKMVSKYIKTLRLYTSGNNLFIITKYTGVDPEISQGGIAPGVDYNNFYPKTRTFLFGVNVTL